MAAVHSTTNTEIKAAVEALSHRFDLFEQKYQERHDVLLHDVTELQHEVFGNGKEGLKAMIKTLWDRHCKNEKRGDTVWIGIVMILITQVLNLILK